MRTALALASLVAVEIIETILALLELPDYNQSISCLLHPITQLQEEDLS